MTTILFGLVALFPLGAAALIFLSHAINQRSQHKHVFQNFNLLMASFMGGWFVTELLEVANIPGIHNQVEFAHVIIMLIFSVVLTWRLIWAKNLSRLDYVTT